MNTHETQEWMDQIVYDFETIRYLISYDRIKETVPIVKKIIKGVGVSQELDFWNQKIGALTYPELVSQIEGEVSQEALKQMGYLEFVSKLEVFLLNKVALDKQRLKSSSQRKTENFMVMLCILILILGLSFMLLRNLTTKDWGLQGVFYGGKNFEQLLYAKSTKTVNFSTMRQVASKGPIENCSLKYEGALLIPQAGVYTFILEVDDGGRLFIDDQLLIDAWVDQNPTEYKKDLNLTQGNHNIRVEYYNNTGSSFLKLSWKYGANKQEVIPARFLRQK